MIIRTAFKCDIEKVFDFMIEIGYFPEKANKLVKKINDPNYTIMVLDENPKLVAYVGIAEKELNQMANEFVDIDNYSYLMGLAVHPNKRNRGLGSYLIKKSDQVSIDLDKKGIWLDCDADRINFYEINGYRVRGYYNHLEKSKFVLAKEY